MKNNHQDYRCISFYNEYSELPHKCSAKKNSIVLARFNSPFGELLAGATAIGLCLLEYIDTTRITLQLSRLKKSHGGDIINANSHYFRLLEQQLNAYFAAELSEFSIPLDIHGTAFQRQVWATLQTIPYGETRCYQQQAIAMGNPKAVRAVANANRNNKISIIIPCHRVIGKNGNMTGYGGGIWRKEYLLNLEKMKKIRTITTK
jgi:AraC family transcriptional regulator of adaptative response/methylated-DNA-[protein]-cysteine methyltransferase